MNKMPFKCNKCHGIGYYFQSLTMGRLRKVSCDCQDGIIHSMSGETHSLESSYDTTDLKKPRTVCNKCYGTFYYFEENPLRKKRCECQGGVMRWESDKTEVKK